MKAILFALFLFLLASCGPSTKTILNSWVGKDKSDLIMKWGPPTQTTSDGKGGEVLVYAHRVYSNTGGNVYDAWQYRMMYADTNGKIYHWLFKQNPNPPERVDVRVLLY
ncbi:MAG: hypothetical protein WCF67_15095 [Chitinophagaceae bacterium]